MRPETKFTQIWISFHCKKNYVKISFHRQWSKIKFIFVLISWSSIIFVLMKYSHALMFSFGFFHFGIIFAQHLSLKIKSHFGQNDRVEITPAMSFSSGHFMSTVLTDWLDTEPKIVHFAWSEISCKVPLNIPFPSITHRSSHMHISNATAKSLKVH